MKKYFLRHTIMYMVLLILFSTNKGAFSEMTTQEENGSSMTYLLRQMEFHTQGWGQMGRNVAAHAPDIEPLSLRIADTEYNYGLGVHAPSETMLSLEGRFLRFDAEVGVQWQDGGPGSVQFEVYVDEKKVFDSGLMTEHTPAKSVSVSLEDADELRLVVKDGGDGIMNDAANWANPRLVSNPAIQAMEQELIDIAQFGYINTSEPNRKEGIRSSRLEEVLEEDLFLDKHLLPDGDGVFEIPLWGDTGCLGVQWVERRRIRSLSLELVPGQILPDASSVSLEYWKVPMHGITPGGAPWQGKWSSLPGVLDLDGNTMIYHLNWGDEPELRDGVYKFRWLVGGLESPLKVKELLAFTINRWVENEFVIVLDDLVVNPPVTLEIYNGFFVSGDAKTHQYVLESNEDKMRIHYCSPSRWRMSDRSVLRIRTSEEAFAIALDDILREESVYVPYGGVFVSTAKATTTLDEAKERLAEGKTVLEQVEVMPEQTYEQAIEYTHRAEGDLGPTMLSLANDNFKFVLTREGRLTFEPDLEAANLYETGLNRPYPMEIQPQIPGIDAADVSITRTFHRDAVWYPVPTITLQHENLEIIQQTLVAPLDIPVKGAQTPVWKSGHPLGVMDLTMHNKGEEAANFTMALSINHQENTDAIRIEAAGDDWIVLFGDQPVVRVYTMPGSNSKLSIQAETPSRLLLETMLQPQEESQVRLLIPRWEISTSEMLALDPEAPYLAYAIAHWDLVFDGSMSAQLPDTMLQDTMRASIIHCLLASRSEDYERVAPWIASIFYGPLESESNSIVRGLAYWGHDDYTRRALEYYIARYNEAGYFTTGYTTMGTGWHLWSVGEYFRLTQDRDWLEKHAAELKRVARWVQAQSEKTMVLDAAGNKMPEYGLVPPGPAADWESFQYYFYINGYYYVGLRSVAEALKSIGDQEADAMLAYAETHRQHILDAFRYAQERAPVVKLRDGSWVPFNPSHPYAWGLMENLYPGQDVGRSWAYDVELGSHHLVPMGVIAPQSRETDWMLDHMEDVQFLKSGWMYYPAEENEADWFNLGGFAKVQPYYARNFDILAMRNDVKPFIRSYFNSISSLINREDLSLWEHFFNGAYNKTHETGYLVYQSRLMLLKEENETLWIAPFIPEAWYTQELPVVVSDAPTPWGRISYHILPNPAEHTISLEVDLSECHKLPEQLAFRVRLQEGMHIVDVQHENLATLTHDVEESTLFLVPKNQERIQVTIKYSNS